MVNRNTSNVATLGELGRYPVQITVIIRMLKFWKRTIELEDNSLLKETPLHEQVRTLHTNHHQWSYFVNQIMSISNVEKRVNEGKSLNIGDLIKKLSHTLQERFISFWRKSIWSNKSACETNHSNKLRTYCYFKKSFTNETYLNYVKIVNHRKALCQLRNSSHTLMCEVGRYHKLLYEQRNRLFCPSKKVESEFHFLFECQCSNDLRRGGVKEKATLGNQGSPSLRCFFSLLSTKDDLVLHHLAKYVYSAFEKRKKSDL